MKRMGFLSFAVLATLTVACSRDKGNASAQTKVDERAAAGTSVPADMVSRDARDFVHHVAVVNAGEIGLGKLAAEHGAADAVKKFGEMMVRDHTASGEKLKVLAADLKIDAPDQLDDKQTDLRNTLAKQSGADFDREYAAAMVDGHKDLLDQLEPRVDKKALEQWKVAMNGRTTGAGTIPLLPDKSDNPTTMRVNQLAADLYPTVHAHLEAAKALDSSLKKR